MKIRIRGNSIRYRLDKKDIATLQEQQQIVEVTTIGASALLFIIKAADKVDIKLEANSVYLFLPHAQLDQWINTEQVGFEHHVANADSSELYILVEKDFKCLTERTEDESNAFDNPNEHC
jgi:hypothetical protein